MGALRMAAAGAPGSWAAFALLASERCGLSWRSHGLGALGRARRDIPLAPGGRRNSPPRFWPPVLLHLLSSPPGGREMGQGGGRQAPRPGAGMPRANRPRSTSVYRDRGGVESVCVGGGWRGEVGVHGNWEHPPCLHLLHFRLIKTLGTRSSSQR